MYASHSLVRRRMISFTVAHHVISVKFKRFIVRSIATLKGSQKLKPPLGKRDRDLICDAISSHISSTCVGTNQCDNHCHKGHKNLIPSCAHRYHSVAIIVITDAVIGIVVSHHFIFGRLYVACSSEVKGHKIIEKGHVICHESLANQFYDSCCGAPSFSVCELI